MKTALLEDADEKATVKVLKAALLEDADEQATVKAWR